MIDIITKNANVARKARDIKLLAVLTMMKSVLLENSKAKKPKSDEDALKFYRKQLQKSLEFFKEPDAVAGINYEIEVISNYLPEEMSDESVREIIKVAVSAATPEQRNMGNMMKLIMGQLKNCADGKTVSKILREALA